jgi:hypothetical protein
MMWLLRVLIGLWGNWGIRIKNIPDRLAKFSGNSQVAACQRHAPWEIPSTALRAGSSFRLKAAPLSMTGDLSC